MKKRTIKLIITTIFILIGTMLINTSTAAQGPSIDISKTDGQGPCDYAEDGEIITYQIHFNNNNSQAFKEVFIRDDLPTELSFHNSSHPANFEDHWVEWTIAEDTELLDPYHNETIWLNVTVDTSQSQGYEVLNTVTIFYEEICCSNPHQRTATEITKIGNPTYEPLIIEKTDNRDNNAVPPAGKINYTISIENPNDISVYNITITDTLPQQVDFNQETESQAHFVEYIQHPTEHWVTYAFNHLAPGEQKTVFLVVDVKPQYSEGTPMTNTVETCYYEDCSDQYICSSTTEETWIQDITPPKTTQTIGNPQYKKNGQTWVTTRTPISLTTVDTGSTKAYTLYYTIDWQNQYGHWGEIENVTIQDNGQEDTNPTDGIIETTFTFNETCTHRLTYWSKDIIGNTEQKNWTIHPVDDTPPHMTRLLFGPYDEHFYKYDDYWYWGLSDETMIYLWSTGDRGCQSGVGFDFIEYNLYHGLTPNTMQLIKNQKTHFSCIPIYFYQSGWYELDYWADDLLSNRYPNQHGKKTMKIMVDNTNPTASLSLEGPLYESPEYKNYITSATTIALHANDTGGIPGGSGVRKMHWAIDFYQTNQQSWKTIQNDTIYDNDLDDIDGTPATPSTGNQGGLYAFDPSGEPYIFHDSNNNWQYDLDEQVIDYDPDQDGFINEFIADPQECDRGGLWAMDEKNEPYMFRDCNNNWIYDNDEPIINTDPDEDSDDNGITITKHIADPQYGQHGGYYAYDENNEPYVFQDSNGNHHYDTDEPLVTLKPDYDGQGTITMNLNCDEDCRHRIRYQPIDRFNNQGTEYSQTFYVDNYAPSTTMSTGQPKLGCNQYTCITPDTPITIQSIDQLSPCDSGIDFIYYEYNGQTFEEHIWDEVTFTIPDTGVIILTWYAVDNIGNVEAHNPQNQHTFYVDDNPPQPSISIGQPKVENNQKTWITSETDITLNVAVGGCPCYDMQYRINKDSEQGEWYHLIDDDLPHEIPNHLIQEDNRYEIEIQIDDHLHPLATSKKIVYVDNTPPSMGNIYGPTNGEWYSDGSFIPIIMESVDTDPFIEHYNPVGIPQNHQGKAYLIDVYPNFAYVPLESSNLRYDTATQRFMGNVGIPENSGLTDGVVLFIAETSDELNNSINTMLDLLYSYYQQANNDNQFISLINQMQEDIIWIRIDNTPPEITIQTPFSGQTIGPGFFSFQATATDALSHFTGDARCHVTLWGMDIASLELDNDGVCSGTLDIPSSLPSQQNIPLKATITDRAGTTGSQSIMVNLQQEGTDTIPQAMILSPLSDQSYENLLPITVHASDDETPMENLDVTIWVERTGDPAFTYTPTYDEINHQFTYALDISNYTNATSLKISAYVKDSDGNNGFAEPVNCIITSDVIYDTWMTTGWNHLHLTMIDAENTVEEVFSCIWDNFEAAFEEDTWHNYVKGEGGNTLSIIDPTAWYWVKMQNPDRFYITE